MGKLKLGLLILAGVVALVWRLATRPAAGAGEAQEMQDKLADALRARAKAEQEKKEAQAHADLQEKRRRPLAERLAGALERARQRAGAPDDGAS